VLTGQRHGPRARGKNTREPGPVWAAIWLWPKDANRTESLYFSVALDGKPVYCSEMFTIQQIENGPASTIASRESPHA
jgi:hypothetical protein